MRFISDRTYRGSTGSFTGLLLLSSSARAVFRCPIFAEFSSFKIPSYFNVEYSWGSRTIELIDRNFTISRFEFGSTHVFLLKNNVRKGEYYSGVRLPDGHLVRTPNGAVKRRQSSGRRTPLYKVKWA